MLTFAPGEVDVWHRRLVDAEATVDRESRVLPRFNVYAGFVRNLTGYRIEFQQILI